MTAPKDPIRPDLTEWHCTLDEVDYVCGYYIDDSGRPWLDQITVGGYDMAGVLVDAVLRQLEREMSAHAKAATADDNVSQIITWSIAAREAA